jgi:hypothetical protein
VTATIFDHDRIVALQAAMYEAVKHEPDDTIVLAAVLIFAAKEWLLVGKSPAEWLAFCATVMRGTIIDLQEQPVLQGNEGLPKQVVKTH